MHSALRRLVDACECACEHVCVPEAWLLRGRTSVAASGSRPGHREGDTQASMALYEEHSSDTGNWVGSGRDLLLRRRNPAREPHPRRLTSTPTPRPVQHTPCRSPSSRSPYRPPLPQLIMNVCPPSLALALPAPPPPPPPQAERWGSELYTEDVEQVDLSVRPFVIRSSDRELRAHSVIIATGATAKRLGLPSENTFWSRGISACAICDGASPLFKNAEVAVVGGGDSATEEAVYVTKYAKHVSGGRGGVQGEGWRDGQLKVGQLGWAGVGLVWRGRGQGRYRQSALGMAGGGRGAWGGAAPKRMGLTLGPLLSAWLLLLLRLRLPPSLSGPQVHLLVRGERMRASKAMQDRVLANPRITVHFNTGIEDAFGGEVLQGLRLFDTRTGVRGSSGRKEGGRKGGALGGALGGGA
mgnify:CR=1 FL=1